MIKKLIFFFVFMIGIILYPHFVNFMLNKYDPRIHDNDAKPEMQIDEGGLRRFRDNEISMFLEIKEIENLDGRFYLNASSNYPLPYVIGEVFTIEAIDENLKFDEGKLTLIVNDFLLVDNPIEGLWVGCMHNENGYVERLDTTVESYNSLSIGLNSDKLLECSMYFVVSAEQYDICKTNMGRYGILDFSD